jgi:hypothetical protein
MRGRETHGDRWENYTEEEQRWLNILGEAFNTRGCTPGVVMKALNTILEPMRSALSAEKAAREKAEARLDNPRHRDLANMEMDYARAAAERDQSRLSLSMCRAERDEWKERAQSARVEALEQSVGAACRQLNEHMRASERAIIGRVIVAIRALKGDGK